MAAMLIGTMCDQREADSASISNIASAEEEAGLRRIEAHLVRRAREIYQRRRWRDTHFGHGLFAEPAWDMLLDLYIAEAEGRDICVSSACIGAAVPMTTALRQVERMQRCGLLQRVKNPRDRRSTLIQLTDLAIRDMTHYLRWEAHRERDDRFFGGQSVDTRRKERTGLS